MKSWSQNHSTKRQNKTFAGGQCKFARSGGTFTLKDFEFNSIANKTVTFIMNYLNFICKFSVALYIKSKHDWLWGRKKVLYFVYGLLKLVECSKKQQRISKMNMLKVMRQTKKIGIMTQ